MKLSRARVVALLKRDIESQDQVSPWFVRVITWPLSLLLALIVRLRHSLYDLGVLPRFALPGVTISVGNIAVGGTGKSPMVMEVVRALRAHGAQCAIVTRGYGSDLGAKDLMVLLNGNLIFSSRPSARIPDEARMQSVHLPDVPVIIGRDRWRTATFAIRSGIITPPTHWILDDGFQHRRLTRHLDIVLLDSERPFGNGYLLPRGNLREPPSSLHRADVVFLTRARSRTPDPETVTRIQSIGRSPVIAVPFLSRLRPQAVSDASLVFDPVKHGSIAVVCGIARPQPIVAELLRQGMTVHSTYFVGDHQSFERETLAQLAKEAGAIVTTEKDYYRDPAMFAHLACPVFIQDLSLDLDAGELWDALARVLLKTP